MNQVTSELIRMLLGLPGEAEWVERKYNNGDPNEVGEYISALSNSAALHHKDAGYVIWGVEDGTGNVVGTTFTPRTAKVGNEELENWLSRLLTPRIDFYFSEVDYSGHRLVVLRILPATTSPVRFQENEWIRIGTYKKKLKEFPEKERALWAVFSKRPWELQSATGPVGVDEVLRTIDYTKYFELTGQPLPENRDGIISKLTSDKVVQHKGGGLYDVTNLGAILFAKNLSSFDSVARKALRVVIYDGPSKVNAIRETTGAKGYAAGFEGAVQFILSQLPQNEVIGQALRTEVTVYPERAIRELVANALIHQDFALSGTGPMVEVFSDRIEITNPGTPLIDPLRFIDEPPQSRNEAVASFMRRMKFCEERGSGIDRVIHLIELFQLPPPDFRVFQNHTQAVMFAPLKFADLDQDGRVRACYQHACLLYVSNSKMTNSSLRKRLAIAEQNYAMASRIISDTIDKGWIKPYDPANKSKKHASYVPFWA